MSVPCTIHYFFFAQNAQIKVKIHNAIVQPPKRFIRNIKNVAVVFLPDAMIVGRKYINKAIIPSRTREIIAILFFVCILMIKATKFF